MSKSCSPDHLKRGGTKRVFLDSNADTVRITIFACEKARCGYEAQFDLRGPKTHFVGTELCPLSRNGVTVFHFAQSTGIL